MARQNPAPFKRRILGYQRSAVETQVAALESQLAECQATLDAHESSHAELALRATRNAVAKIMADAHAEADRIRAAAHDETIIDLTIDTSPDTDALGNGTGEEIANSA